MQDKALALEEISDRAVRLRSNSLLNFRREITFYNLFYDKNHSASLTISLIVNKTQAFRKKVTKFC